MGVGLLLSTVLFDELFGSLEGILAFFTFLLESQLAANLVVDCLLVLLAFAHDVSKHVLLSKHKHNQYST